MGRFLEHSRVFRFENGGQPEHYIGSADWMKRNLNNRVETVTPIEDASLKAELDEILAVVRRCFDALAADCDRIECDLRLDYRRDRTGRIDAKVASVEKRLGRELSR